jgi:predicted transcriptional regulator of viral defense system
MKPSVEQLFRQHGGRLRMSEALAQGVSRRRFYALRDEGTIEQLSRGVYRLAELPPLSEPDMVAVALRAPKAVVCLVSALAFHELTTQIPQAVAIALPTRSRAPRLDNPPLEVHHFSPLAWQAGIEEHSLDGVTVKVYSAEKTLADCFKFRNRIGMESVLEALKLYRMRKKFNLKKLVEYARVCRVETVMRPYLAMVV